MIQESSVLDPQIKALLDAAYISDKAKEFLQSELGSFLVSRAREEAEAALMGLANADPDDPKTIRARQFELRVAEACLGWLAEAITEGENALKELYEE